MPQEPRALRSRAALPPPHATRRKRPAHHHEGSFCPPRVPRNRDVGPQQTSLSLLSLPPELRSGLNPFPPAYTPGTERIFYLAQPVLLVLLLCGYLRHYCSKANFLCHLYYFIMPLVSKRESQPKTLSRSGSVSLFLTLALIFITANAHTLKPQRILPNGALYQAQLLVADNTRQLVWLGTAGRLQLYNITSGRTFNFSSFHIDFEALSSMEYFFTRHGISVAATSHKVFSCCWSPSRAPVCSAAAAFYSFLDGIPIDRSESFPSLIPDFYQ